MQGTSWSVHSIGWELQLFSSDENGLVWKLVARSLLVIWWLLAHSYWLYIMLILSVGTCSVIGCCRASSLWCNVAWSFKFPLSLKHESLWDMYFFYFKLLKCKVCPLITRNPFSARVILMKSCKFGCSKLDHNYWQMFILPFQRE
jgi:hypothetical protein